MKFVTCINISVFEWNITEILKENKLKFSRVEYCIYTVEISCYIAKMQIQPFIVHWFKDYYNNLLLLDQARARQKKHEFSQKLLVNLDSFSSIYDV